MWFTITVNHITETDTQFAGLCLMCHNQTSLKTAWSGHGTVKGWGGATRDLISRNLIGNLHRTERLTETFWGSKKGMGYRWGVDPVNQQTSGYKQTDYHQFPCSKCHTPHANDLPRMISTDCLDNAHSTYTGRTSSQAMNCHSRTRNVFWNTKTLW